MKTLLLFAAALLLVSGAASFVGEEKSKTVEFGKDEKHSMSIPESWSASEPGGMRALEVKVPKTGDDKDDGEIAIFTHERRPAWRAGESDAMEGLFRRRGSEENRSEIRRGQGRDRG